MSSQKLNLFSFKGKIRILHLSWIAFFISFVVWFSHAPLMSSIRDTFGLTDQEVKTLLILNVALTIPARIIVGMLVDAFGPRRIYSLLLFISSFICFGFAFAETFQQLALMRFLLGFVGAGFVIGIRMISEWFPAKQVGVAEGIYGGWGNFGSAAAAIMLPTIALMYGGDNGSCSPESREPLGPSLSGVHHQMDSTSPAICVGPDRPASVMIHHSHNGSTPFHGYRGLSALVFTLPGR